MDLVSTELYSSSGNSFIYFYSYQEFWAFSDRFITCDHKFRLTGNKMCVIIKPQWHNILNGWRTETCSKFLNMKINVQLQLNRQNTLFQKKKLSKYNIRRTTKHIMCHYLFNTCSMWKTQHILTASMGIKRVRSSQMLLIKYIWLIDHQ